jgi:hypothetical protein
MLHWSPLAVDRERERERERDIYMAVSKYSFSTAYPITRRRFHRYETGPPVSYL